MSSLDRHTLAWLHDHHATISSEALRASGITLDQRKNLVHSGLLERVVDGAYTLGAVDVGELERCAALCTSRPHLVVAGPTAGGCGDCGGRPEDGLVHVIAPPRQPPVPGTVGAALPHVVARRGTTSSAVTTASVSPARRARSST